MQNLSDDDIDKLFKRAAEQQQTQFDPADWDNMASRLDANKRPWLNYYTGMGSMVLLGVVIWLGWLLTEQEAPTTESVLTTFQNETSSNNHRPANDLNTDLVDARDIRTSAPKVEDGVTERSPSEESNATNLSEETEANTVRSFAKVRSQPKSSDGKSSSIADVGIGEPSKSSTLSISSNQNQATEPPQASGENSIVKDQNKTSKKESDLSLEKKPLNDSGIVIKTGSITALDKESTLLPSQTKSDANEVSPQGIREYESDIDIKTTTESAVDSVEEVIIDKEDISERVTKINLRDSAVERSTFSRFALKATVAPDFSSDRFKSVEKMGFNYGLVVEYFLVKNLSITTGALWSRKYYSAEDVSYDGYHADRAYGDCRMWDIPVNVNYYFTPSKQFSFFASAGLSSYLMNEENYVYEVDSGYGTKTYTSQVIKENKEWFKTLNVSVGLQKQINSRLVVQVEPFIKVPLVGVGEGNISLASFGSFFSLRYNFLSPHK